MTTTTVYADIVKATENDDGTMTVTGKATGPDLDLDQQVCDPKWLEKAVPQWFATGANVREQHGSTAAGVGMSIEQDGDSWNLESLVVDPVSVKKVQKGVLKGYSIGIRDAKVIKDAAAPGGRIVDGQIVEVSLVDRPANPSCQLVLAKAAESGDLEEVTEQALVETPADPPAVEIDLDALAAKVAKILKGDKPEKAKTSAADKAAKAKAHKSEKKARKAERVAIEKAAEERYDALAAKLEEVTAELEVIKKSPVPGGPVLTPPAKPSDPEPRNDLLAKAADHRAKAEQITDPNLSAYHAAQARKFEAQAKDDTAAA